MLEKCVLSAALFLTCERAPPPLAPSLPSSSGRVFLWVKENLPKAKQQGEESAEEHRRRQNDAKAHTGNQVYSCGSLAPKLKKGGCSDCEVRCGAPSARECG